MQVRTRFGEANPVVACSARGDVTHTHASASGCRQRRLPVFDAMKRTTAIFQMHVIGIRIMF
jgi:hypothetical protein